MEKTHRFHTLKVLSHAHRIRCVAATHGPVRRGAARRSAMQCIRCESSGAWRCIPCRAVPRRIRYQRTLSLHGSWIIPDLLCYNGSFLFFCHFFRKLPYVFPCGYVKLTNCQLSPYVYGSCLSFVDALSIHRPNRYSGTFILLIQCNVGYCTVYYTWSI